LAAYEAAKAELDALGVSVFAVSADNEEQAREVKGKGLSFPVAYGATKTDADTIGAWWSDDRGGFVQPSEFLLGRGGVVLGAMYASGPVGRMSAEEVVHAITNRENRRRREEGESPG
jgi:peroxiredoxin